jgi:hypothetical protein
MLRKASMSQKDRVILKQTNKCVVYVDFGIVLTVNQGLSIEPSLRAVNEEASLGDFSEGSP